MQEEYKSKRTFVSIPIAAGRTFAINLKISGFWVGGGNKNASPKHRPNTGNLHGAWVCETLERRFKKWHKFPKDRSPQMVGKPQSGAGL